MLGYKKHKEEQQAKYREQQITAQRPTYQQRVLKDLDELEKHWRDNMVIEDNEALNRFTITIIPTEGIWNGIPHLFEMNIPETYPQKPPKFICKTKIFHPNISDNGVPDVHVLTDYRPTYTFNHFFTGLLFLFLEPNPNDPMNIEAANIYNRDLETFKSIAKNYSKGAQK